MTGSKDMQNNSDKIETKGNFRVDIIGGVDREIQVNIDLMKLNL